MEMVAGNHPGMKLYGEQFLRQVEKTNHLTLEKCILIDETTPLEHTICEFHEGLLLNVDSRIPSHIRNLLDCLDREFRQDFK